MDLVTGNLFWTNKNNIIRQYPYLSENISCEAVIIGAGITGALCAYYLSSAGIPTVIVDKNIIGYGSTSASTSLLQYEVDYDMTELAKMIGVEKAVASFKQCEQALYDIQNIVKELDDTCDFKRRDSLYYTANDSEITDIEQEYYMRKAHGFNVELLDSKKAGEMFSFPISSAIYSHCGSGEVDPYRFSHALIYKASSLGLKAYENTEIVDIQLHKDGVTLITNNNMKVTANKAIIAVGYDVNRIIDDDIVTLNRTFTIVTKPVTSFNGWHKRCLIRNTNTPYTYLRTTSDDRIIIGGLDSRLTGITDMSLISNRKFTALLNILKEMFPQILNIEMEYAFSGLFGETKDGLPYIGEHSKMPNCYFSLDYGSNGILYGILGAQIIKDLMQGKTSSIGEFFKFNR